MRLVALQSLINVAVSAVSGFPIPPRAPCFQRLGGFPGNVGPRFLAITGSSSPELLLLFRVRSCLLPARCPRAPGASLGVFLPFATQAHRVHFPTTVPPAIFVPSSAFLALSTGYSSAIRVGLFHPTATYGICTSGVFPATQPTRLFDVPYPLAVSRKSPPIELPLRCQILPLRLQGFNPSSDPW
jgi:hypothetical protein